MPKKALLTREGLIRRMEVPSAAPIRTAMLAAHAEALFQPTIGNITLNQSAKVVVQAVFEDEMAERDGNPFPPEFKAKPGQVYVTNSTAPREILVGVGKREKFDTEAARCYGATAIREAEKLRSDSVSVSVKGLGKDSGSDGIHIEAVVFGAVLAAYRFEQKLVVSVDQSPVAIKRLDILGRFDAVDGSILKSVERALLLGGCQNTARYLSDMPADQLNPLHYALLLRQIAHKYGIPHTRLRPTELSLMGLNGIKTVGKGSDFPGSMVIMGDLSTSVEPVVLVGKGLTMDSGGYDTKSPGTMGDMLFDMEGSAAVVMAQVALARMGIGSGSIAVACIAENKINGRAFVSGDIISIGGRTIQVMHTDAEGRIVLADGLSVASNIVDPKQNGAIFSIATLTGAACRAVGSNIAAPIFSSDKQLVDALNSAAKATGEPVHHFEIHSALAKLIKGTKTDLITVAQNGGEAGHVTAAAFLREFARNYTEGGEGREVERYAHIDMAPMMDAHAAPASEDPRYRTGKFALGYGVNLLVETVNRLR